MEYPNDTIRTLFEKHTIRKYTDEPVARAELELIVQAGLRAPSSGGTQGPVLVVCEDREMNLKLGRLSKSLYDEGAYAVSSAQPSIADDDTLEDGFYGAPVMVHCFTPRNYSYSPFDGSMAAANMMTAAWSLDIGSCFVSRAQRLFEVDWAREWARDLGVSDDWEGCFHLCLGHPADWSWSPKPPYPDRLFWA